jgi:transcriptional regulator with XRE-family HTH domain
MITAQQVKDIRTSLRITQVEMARELKVDPGTVSRWEREEQRPSKRDIRKILRLERK